MNPSRGTDINRLALRPKGGAFEPKKDCFGRDSFRMPEVRSLSALAMMHEDDPVYRHRPRPGDKKSRTSDRFILSRSGRARP